MSWTADQWNEFLARCDEIRALLAQARADLEASVESLRTSTERLTAVADSATSANDD